MSWRYGRLHLGSCCLASVHQGEGEQKPLNSIPAVGGIVPLSVGAIDPASAPAAVKAAFEVRPAQQLVQFKCPCKTPATMCPLHGPSRRSPTMST